MHCDDGYPTLDELPDMLPDRFGQVVARARREHWPMLESFLAAAAQTEQLKRPAAAAYLGLVAYTLPRPVFEHLWESCFASFIGGAHGGQYLNLAKIAQKRLDHARFCRAMTQAYLIMHRTLQRGHRAPDHHIRHALNVSGILRDISAIERLTAEAKRRKLKDYNTNTLPVPEQQAAYDAVEPGLFDRLRAAGQSDEFLDARLHGELPIEGKLNIYAEFIVYRKHSPANEITRKFLLRLRAVAEAMNVPVAFRHPSVNSYQTPRSRGQPVVAIHTISDGFRPGLLHLKPSHLLGFMSVDRAGYSAWSEWADVEMGHDAKPDAADLSLFEHLQASYVQHHNSYASSELETPIPQGLLYIFVILQIESDSTQAAAYMPMLDMLDTVVEWGRDAGAHIVVKRHPKCTSHRVAVAMDRIDREPHVLCARGNVQEIAAGAACVVTTNSGAGFEVLLQNKTVITTGKCDYRGATWEARTAQELRRRLDDAWAGKRVSPAVIQAFVARYIRGKCVALESPELDDQIVRQVALPVLGRSALPAWACSKQL